MIINLKEKNILEMMHQYLKGQYLHDKKWNGKEYENDDIIAELINGNGTVIEYNKKGEVIFARKYVNGRRNGFGGEYQKLIFEGEYLNGKRNGKGKEYDNGQLEFEGEYLNGEKWNGKGYDRNGDNVYTLNNGNGKIMIYNDIMTTINYYLNLL